MIRVIRVISVPLFKKLIKNQKNESGIIHSQQFNP